MTRWAISHRIAPEIYQAAGREVQRATQVGSPAAEITWFAREQKADLIVVGSHGRGAMKRLRLGSISDRVAYLAAVPVLIVRCCERPVEIGTHPEDCEARGRRTGSLAIEQ
jgi:nucleotide-binding universal stress UspA family protein